MPRKISIPDDTIRWLHENHHHASYRDMADRVGCCIDTLKRILVREGLQEFQSPKYAPTPKHLIQVWSRPCMNCGSTVPRPKNHYMCPSCRAQIGYSQP